MADVYDLALDSATWDLSVVKKANGLYDLQLITGADRILQAIKIRLRTWYGEWFLDTTIGLPYLDKIMVKNPSLPTIDNLLRAEILAVDGVAYAPSVVSVVDASKRTLSVTFTADTTYGRISAIEDLSQVRPNGN